MIYIQDTNDPFWNPANLWQHHFQYIQDFRVL